MVRIRSQPATHRRNRRFCTAVSIVLGLPLLLDRWLPDDPDGPPGCPQRNPYRIEQKLIGTRGASGAMNLCSVLHTAALNTEGLVGELKAVIQAGGRGTRLAPYSTVLPKALMPIGEGTVIDQLLNRFRDAGVSQVIITVSRFGPLIRSYCGDGSRWNLEIDYVMEDSPLGTIGGLNLLRDRLDDSFFVANSDVYTDLELKDLLAAHASGEAAVTVAITRQKVSIAYGVLDHADGRVREFREKPIEQFSVSTGIYCMDPEVFKFIPSAGSFGFDHLMRTMLDRGAPVGVFEHLGSWIDIGRVEDLRKAQEQAAQPFVPDEVL